MPEIFYDIALSYASEDREYVQAVAAELKARKVLCFYDEYSTGELLGENLTTHLDEVYNKTSRFVVIFVSKNYVAKVWTRLEFQVALKAAREMERTYILPVRLDDTKVPELDENMVYADRSRMEPAALAAEIHKKLLLSPRTRALLLQKSLLRRLLEVNWQTVFLVGFIAGVALIAGSYAIGVADVRYPQDETLARQVGYVYALNWSVGYLILFPAATALLISALNEANWLFDHLEERGMLRTEAWVRPDRPGDVLRICWLRGNKMRQWCLFVLCSVLAIVLMREWYTNNYCRLYRGTSVKGINDVDWGLASTFLNGTALQRFCNVSFDFCAFGAEASYIAMLVAFTVYVADVARVLTSEAEQLGIKIWPTLKTDDVRRGFQEFEPLLKSMLLVVMVGYLFAYLVRVENLYLTSASGDVVNGLPVVRAVHGHTLWEFIHYEASEMMEDFQRGWSIGVLFQMKGWTRQTILSGLAVLFWWFVAVVILLVTVWTVADRAKGNAMRYYDNFKIPLFERSVEEEKTLLKEMKVWPLGWMALNGLIAWTLVAIVSLVWYRLGALVFLATLVYLFYRALKALVADQHSA